MLISSVASLVGKRNKKCSSSTTVLKGLEKTIAFACYNANSDSAFNLILEMLLNATLDEKFAEILKWTWAAKLYTRTPSLKLLW